MLWLGGTFLLHFRSNGWALSRSCLHQQVFLQRVVDFGYICVAKKHMSIFNAASQPFLCW